MSPLRRCLAVLLVALAAAALPATARATDIQEVVSPGGIRALLVRDDTVPLFSLRVWFRGGAAADPAGKAGLSNLTASMLTQGAGDLDATAFQQELADRSIGIGFRASRDRTVGSLYALTRDREEAFDLFRLALTEPRFDQRDLDRLKDGLRVRLAREDQDPNAVAHRYFAMAAFGDHPYGRRVDGTVESIADITPDDLRTQADRILTREDMLVGVAGDIGPEELGRLLDNTFGDLPASSDTAPPPPVEPPDEGGIAVIERPVPQSVVVFGSDGIARDDPDWFAASVANHVLGAGGFTSRLTTEIREKRGLAYAIGTWLAPYESAELLQGRVATRNDAVALTIELVREEFRRIAEEGITEQELEDARTYLADSFPLSLDSSGAIAETLLAIQRWDLGLDYLDRRAGLIRSVTAEDVRRVADRLFRADALRFVVVGQPVDVTPTFILPESG